MMKNSFFAGILCFLTFSLTAQDDTRLLDDFSQLAVSGNVSVELHEGSPKAEIVMVKGDAEDVITKVSSGKLKIEIKSGWWSGNKAKARIKLYYENLDEIAASAGSSVKSVERINGSQMEIDVSSGAEVTVDLAVDKLEVDVSSGADCTIDGNSRSLEVDVSSGASFNGKNLKADNVNASASSGGNAEVWADKSLKASASSGGNVSYKGNPEQKNIDVGKYSGGNVSAM